MSNQKQDSGKIRLRAKTQHRELSPSTINEGLPSISSEKSRNPVSLYLKSVLFLSQSECYLAESHEWCFKIYSNLTKHGVSGLCICRENPAKLKKYGLKVEDVMLLSSRSMKGFKTLSTLQDVSLTISNFLKTGGGIVLLDGLEYLISRFGFGAIYKLMQEKRFDFLDADSILLVSVDLETLSKQQRAQLQSELNILKQGILSKQHDNIECYISPLFASLKTDFA